MIYLFNHREELIGELKSEELGAALQEESLNGLMRLDFEVYLSSMEKMRDAEFIAHEDVEDEETYHIYRLISSSNSEETISYTAIHIAYDDFAAYGYIREQRMEKTTARLALETILHGSRWSVGHVEDSKEADFYLYDVTRIEAIGKLLETFGVELKFRIIIKGNQIIGRYVDLYHIRGKETYKRFVYGSNALEVVKEVQQQDIFTAVIGRGKGEEKFDASGETTGGFGRRIQFKDVEWKKENGDPIDKPMGQEYVELPEATKKYGYSDGTPRYKIMIHEDIETPEELLKACYEDLMNGSRPLVQFKGTIQEFGNIGLGDRVGIIRKDLDIYYTTRIFRIKRNLLDGQISDLELGDNIEYNQNKKNKQVKNQLQELNQRVTEVAKSANYTFVEVIKEMREGIKNSYFNDDGYNYELKAGNQYKLPAGYYSFDRPIDKNPTKVIYMGAGKMAIANRKDSNGNWDWRTFGTGDGLLAETIIGTLGEFAKVNANQVNVNNDFATTQLGKKVVIQDHFYNNVKITPEKGIQVLDNYSRERVQLGNWATDRYGLKLTDKSGNRTILDDEGIMQSWQDGRCDNIDRNYPLRLHLYIPKETSKIYKAVLRIYSEGFRAYSRSTKGGGGDYTSTSGGGYQNSYATTDGGDLNIYTTHGAADVDGRMVTVQSSSSNGHYHEVSFYQVQHHEHRIDAGPHRHDVNIRIDGHTHDVRIPQHSHEIDYGIFEEYSGSGTLSIYVNSYSVTSSYGTNGEIDIRSYLNNGTWNEVRIEGNGRGRVDATVFIQALLQYGG